MTITNPGTGYTSPPTISFSSGAAAATGTHRQRRRHLQPTPITYTGNTFVNAGAPEIQNATALGAAGPEVQTILAFGTSSSFQVSFRGQ